MRGLYVPPTVAARGWPRCASLTLLFLHAGCAVDFVSMQAVLFNGATRGWWAQTRTLVKLQARLTED